MKNITETNHSLLPARLLAILCFLLGGSATLSWAQALNWEGQTGVFITPFAYVTPSPGNTLGRPAVAYHYLNGGDVLGGFHQASITEGALQRLEFGYTRDFHQEGSTPDLSSLWGSGFNIFHAKFNFLRENTAGHTWLPAVSLGFVARSQIPNVIGAIKGQDTSNADFYIVGTKTLTQIRRLPLIFNLGYKGTNASLLGLAGNAPAYTGRLFGAAAFAIRGPGDSTLIFGSEFLQEPRAIEGVPGAVLPTTITYAVRIVPAGASPRLHEGWGEQSPKLNIDIGVAQAAGHIAPNVDLNARSQFALGISYGF
jgi:hypothetical protein